MKALTAYLRSNEGLLIFHVWAIVMLMLLASTVFFAAMFGEQMAVPDWHRTMIAVLVVLGLPFILWRTLQLLKAYLKE